MKLLTITRMLFLCMLLTFVQANSAWSQTYDSDNDGISDASDNCIDTYNPDQEDLDGNGIGDACDTDTEPEPDFDLDGISDASDNCIDTYNPDQADSDEDGIGDACDTYTSPCPDRDGDGICDDVDNCPNFSNPDQADLDGNGIGDACDIYTPSCPDRDSDGVCDDADNCPDTYNPGQNNACGLIIAANNNSSDFSDINKDAYKSYSNSYPVATLSTIYSTSNHKNAVFIGAYGGWKVNSKLMIGLGGYGLINDNKGLNNRIKLNKQNSMKMGYGGVMLDYNLWSHKPIHAIVNTLIGAGYGNGYLNSNSNTAYGNWKESGSAFFVVQPSLNVEMKVTNQFSVGVGAGYRYIRGSKLYGINKYMSAPLTNLSFKLALFQGK